MAQDKPAKKHLREVDIISRLKLQFSDRDDFVVWLKEKEENEVAIKQWITNLPKNKKPSKEEIIEKAYWELKKKLGLIERLDRDDPDLTILKEAADSGFRVSWLSKRFLFGFGLAHAIEEWFDAFDKADPSERFEKRIPRKETSNVAAKWAWFGFLGVFVGALLGLSIAGITAYFLYRQSSALEHQLNVLQKSNDLTREANAYVQRTEYTKVLFDKECPATKDCEPTPHSIRNRTEAAFAFLKLEREREKKRGIKPNFSYARLEETKLIGLDVNNAFLYATMLVRADLSNAILNGADLTRANLKDADLIDAHLRNANLAYANLQDADLHKTDLFEADLYDTNLTGAKNLTCEQFKKALNWKHAHPPKYLNLTECN